MKLWCGLEGLSCVPVLELWLLLNVWVFLRDFLGLFVSVLGDMLH